MSVLSARSVLHYRLRKTGSRTASFPFRLFFIVISPAAGPCPIRRGPLSWERSRRTAHSRRAAGREAPQGLGAALDRRTEKRPCLTRALEVVLPLFGKGRTGALFWNARGKSAALIGRGGSRRRKGEILWNRSTTIRPAGSASGRPSCGGTGTCARSAGGTAGAGRPPRCTTSATRTSIRSLPIPTATW